MFTIVESSDAPDDVDTRTVDDHTVDFVGTGHDVELIDLVVVCCRTNPAAVAVVRQRRRRTL
jgi:hypothetical protein